MTARDEVADYWDDLLAKWISGDLEIPDELLPWFQSYAGRGAGIVTVDAFTEPYIGPLRTLRSPRLVCLGLNPGPADLSFQGTGGIYTRQIADASYSSWAAAGPYTDAAWESAKGRNKYHGDRLSFARRLHNDTSIFATDVLYFELYPWHSDRVTAHIRPPHDLLERFIWNPLAEMDVPSVFAFGKPWVEAARNLDLGEGRELHVAWTASGRRALVFDLPSGQDLIVIHQNGYAGPPGERDTESLKVALGLAPAL